MSGTYTRISNVSQDVMAADGSVPIRVSNVSQDVMAADGSVPIRISNIGKSVIAEDTSVYIRVCGAWILSLIPNYIGAYMPPIYPVLAGQSIEVTKRPEWSYGVGTGTSGAEVIVDYWDYPMWEWDLAYTDYLPDYAGTGGTTASDFKALAGFYLATHCGALPFYFSDPDDNTVTAQPINTGDGATTSFLLVRTFGLLAYGTITEPIGLVNSSKTFNVYINGTLQNPSTYTVNTSIQMQQALVFNVAPAGGAVITVDMSYYFWVRFKDDKYDFDRTMNKLWSTKKITLRSKRF